MKIDELRELTEKEKKLIDDWLKKNKPTVNNDAENTDGYTGLKMKGKRDE
jgi:hypothetical protein